MFEIGVRGVFSGYFLGKAISYLNQKVNSY